DGLGGVGPQSEGKAANKFSAYVGIPSRLLEKHSSLSKGDPSAFLPIVSYVFISYSPHLAEHLVGFGVELTGKNDLRFIECIYKVLRDLFHYKPVLTKQQFLQFGYAERKTCILCDVIAFALQKHKELSKGNKPKPRARFQASSSDSKSEALPFQAETMNPMLSLSRPLVERHIGGDSWVSSSRTSDNEESEEEGLGLEEVQNQAPTVPQAVSTSILLHNYKHRHTHSPSLCDTHTHTEWIVTTLPGPGGGGEAGSAGGPAAADPD
uniref:Centrosomal protein of 44 kDa n=1 Tax=Oncorhynchus tshawytscha TaxID=74940 RepID=A0AAZ3RV47_ONCTS